MANLIDGAIIAGQCDGAVIVIESGTISRHLVQKVKVQLEKSGCRILGAVLNKVNQESKGYYGGYYNKYYGKNYGKYSGYGDGGSRGRAEKSEEKTEMKTAAAGGEENQVKRSRRRK